MTSGCILGSRVTGFSEPSPESLKPLRLEGLKRLPSWAGDLGIPVCEGLENSGKRRGW